LENQLTITAQNLSEERNELKEYRESLRKIENSQSNEAAELEIKAASINERLLDLIHLTESEAKELYFKQLDDVLQRQKISTLKKFENETNLESKAIATNILTAAIENISNNIAEDHLIKKIDIPSDDLKGKIIGKEGRNIRTLENLIGVNVIIDETEKQISISSFDPIRRAIGHDVITKLVAHGKINQVEIEKQVELSEIAIEEITINKGNEALYELQLANFDIGLVKIIGSLFFRSSYHQNVLRHSIEAAKIAEGIALQLDLDPVIAKRCSLLHDIGKAYSQQTGRSHVDLGIEIAKRYGESDFVINTIASHHGNISPDSPYAIIAIVADTISSSRPGARQNNFEEYIAKVKKLEEFGTTIKGVKRAYALSGGRELRIIVESQNVEDDQLKVIAFDVKNKIEQEMNFPGIITINVIRENRFKTIATKEQKITNKVPAQLKKPKISNEKTPLIENDINHIADNKNKLFKNTFINKDQFNVTVNSAQGSVVDMRSKKD